MRVFLALLVITLCALAANAALTCFGDEEKCSAEECCIQVGNTPVGICKKKHEIDQICEMKPIKHLFKKHVFKVRCPCKDELKCVSSKGVIIGKFAGKCQENSGEEEE
uniref:Prokineticin domain-containing protein n=1 Tax=Parasteatoda tepidariorum TaxID=114398 RepID=A0A2L2Y2N9_PARTP